MVEHLIVLVTAYMYTLIKLCQQMSKALLLWQVGLTAKVAFFVDAISNSNGWEKIIFNHTNSRKDKGKH